MNRLGWIAEKEREREEEKSLKKKKKTACVAFPDPYSSSTFSIPLYPIDLFTQTLLESGGAVCHTAKGAFNCSLRIVENRKGKL